MNEPAVPSYYQPVDRLCRDCKHFAKFKQDCIKPGLPINLVTGQRRFPAIIARGYEGLCGSLGLLWERK